MLEHLEHMDSDKLAEAMAEYCINCHNLEEIVRVRSWSMDLQNFKTSICLENKIESCHLPAVPMDSDQDSVAAPMGYHLNLVLP